MLDLEYTVKMLTGLIICTIFGTGTLVAVITTADIPDTLRTFLSVVPVIFMVTSVFMALNFIRMEE